MKYAIVEEGVVINVAVAATPLGANWIETWQAGPGWLYQDGQFLPPLPVVPTKEEQQAARAAAYRNEADPIFFQHQRGEATEQDWLDKVEEIRVRYPYPEE